MTSLAGHRLLCAWVLGGVFVAGWSGEACRGQSVAASATAEITAIPAPPSPARITTEALDTLVGQTPPEHAAGDKKPPHEATTSDEQILRRVSFDLVGRPPTVAEARAYLADASPTKFQDLVERLLASEEFGANWADYWSDTIAFHVPPPELTYLDYRPLERWLAAKLNGNAPWDEVVRELITATGKIEENPAATFVGYHQARATNLAAETSRIFLGQQIGCAECHDHPFDHWKRTQFHELAAFFARAKAKLPWNDGPGTVVSSAEKGEYLLPDVDDPKKKGAELRPALLDGTPAFLDKDAEAELADGERRAQLAAWVTARDNPWFARAYVNRIWGRLTGRGFYEPADDLGNSRPHELPAVHEALAEHFVASGFDVKDLFRLVMSSKGYRHNPRFEPGQSSPSTPPRLRGDEVFAALKVGVALPDVTPEAVKPTAEIRFPPPPKSTRQLVNDAFGADPSLSPVDAPRTIGQALWMMNNEQLQAQINAAEGSGTMLAELLAEHKDDTTACRQLFSRTLAREATAEELRISLAHVKRVGERRAAFEDLLWSLVNSAEFTTRR
jgi:hypothetical protein